MQEKVHSLNLLWKNIIYSKLKVIRTTVGRVVFNSVWPDELGFVNAPVAKGKQCLIGAKECAVKKKTPHGCFAAIWSRN